MPSFLDSLHTAKLNGPNSKSSAYVTPRPFDLPSQLDYLKEQMLGGPWAERLMSKVEAIMQQVPAGSSHEGCHFPQLAGSHLTEVGLGYTGAQVLLI